MTHFWTPFWDPQKPRIWRFTCPPHEPYVFSPYIALGTPDPGSQDPKMTHFGGPWTGLGQG